MTAKRQVAEELAVGHSAVLGGTARLIRESIGTHSGFVAELAGPEQAVIRGRVLALGRPVRVTDYVSSPTSSTRRSAACRQWSRRRCGR